MRENVEWSMDSIAIGIGAATSAAIGGILAQKFGFQLVFVIGGILAVFGGVQQLKIYRDLKGKVPRGGVQPLPDRATS